MAWSDPINEDEYFICPMQLITRDLVEWSNEYQYLCEYPASAPKYREQGAKFLEAVQYYKTVFNHFDTIADGRSLPESARDFQ